MWDAGGREFIDAFGGILTTSLGHCHRELVEAVSLQMEDLGHTSTLYVTEPQVEAARALVALMPPSLKRVFFTNSGTEAVETAVQVARHYTGANDVIALRGCYHGRSTLAQALNGIGAWRAPGASSPAVPS